MDQFIAETDVPIQQKAFDSDNLDEINDLHQQNDAPQCTSSLDTSVYHDLPDDEIEEFIEQQSTVASKSSCAALNLGVNAGNIAEDLDKTNRKKRRLSETTNYEAMFEWESTEHFQ